MSECRYCGNEKSDLDNPLIPGCSACDEALTLQTYVYYYGTTDEEAERLEECINELCLKHPDTYCALNDIQDDAVIEAERMKKREIAYYEFKYGARA